eukprot:503484_1
MGKCMSKNPDTELTQELNNDKKKDKAVVDYRLYPQKWHMKCTIKTHFLSCYDEVMFEDETVNSMVDTLQLFDKISNNLYFVKTSVILFLNKKDLFAEKLESGKAITLCPEFRDYDGDAKSFEDATDYVRDVFVRKSRSNKTIFTHLTCATDTENVDKVFNDVQQIIIENSLISAGLMGEMMETEDDENRNLIPTAQAGATANDKDQLLQSQAGAVISVCEENE